MCDHPGSSRADYLDYMRNVMDRCGWAVQGIERDGPHPPWAYTVGLTRLGRPELVVTGMSLHRATHLLNDMAAHSLHADNPKLGEQIELTGGPVIQMIGVAEPTAHLRIATEMFGPRIRALQVVHADDRGHWPWERGYRGVRGGQPVLGLVDPTATMPASPIAWVVPPSSPAAPAEGTETPAAGTTAPTAAPSRRPTGRRDAAKRRPSRGSGKRRASRGPRQRSARSSPRPPSPRR
ncbi:MAG TPA: DUF4262 domain-containing protein [Streptosporangiaceae bacterium]